MCLNEREYALIEGSPNPAIAPGQDRWGFLADCEVENLYASQVNDKNLL